MKNEIDHTGELLLGNFSRSYTDMQVEMIAQKPALLEFYWQHYIRFEGRISARAAWVITHAVIRMPHLILPYLKDMVGLAPYMKQDSEKRTLAKVLSLVPIPDDLQGEVIDRCFGWLDDPGESIAVRVYCMDALLALCKDVPEIRGELCATIENHLDRFSIGLKNKGMKVIKRLKRDTIKQEMQSSIKY